MEFRSDDSQLRVGAHRVDGRTVVIPLGEIDLATSGVLRDALASCSGAVDVDLSAVSFLDSSGIGVLAGQRKRLQASGGALVLHYAKDQVRRTLEAVGLADWLAD